MESANKTAEVRGVVAALRASHEIGRLVTHSTADDAEAVITQACEILGNAVGADIVG